MEITSTPTQVYERDGEIVLRSADLADAELICSYFVENRDFLKPWEPARDEEFYTHYGWYQRLTKLRELHKMMLGYYLLITEAESGKMLGTISFSNLVRFPMHSCTVGYSLAESAQGKGVMTKALKMACDYMFRIHNMHRVCACYMPHNGRSEAVLQRLGFEYEGMAKSYLLINGEWADHNMTALINPNWRG
ncbi:ribosomal protein S5-alanine N-acetyltransferase [Vibrio tritonius]|uniref:ribosomal protein S5-alanine N-acetyltransferase n=1 Tax=Vibrio tritonius TaxID=1435069 RepID=UPI0008381C50|nr:ribosomal protein S5-alanine N-acetyltransferase [Vibrio tritonius]